MCFVGLHNWGTGEVISVQIQHLIKDYDEGMKIVKQDAERCQFKCSWCGKVIRKKL